MTKDDKALFEQNKMMSQMSDIVESLEHGHPTQQTLSAFWEQQVLDTKELCSKPISLEDAQQLMDAIRSAYAIKSPIKVKVDKGLPDNIEGGTHWDNKHKANVVYFNPNPEYMTKYTLMHEASHCALNSLGRYEDNSHGPSFVRVFCDIISRFGGFDLSATIKSAKDTGLCVDKDLPKGLAYHAPKKEAA